MTTGGDVEYTILYRVHQRTTVKRENILTVVERFNRELELQFGSSCDVEVMAVQAVAGERVLRTRSGTPLNADTDPSRGSEVDSPPLTPRERRRQRIRSSRIREQRPPG